MYQQTRRRVLKRSFGWAAKIRRLARDDERLAETSSACHWLAFALLMLKNFTLQTASQALDVIHLEPAGVADGRADTEYAAKGPKKLNKTMFSSALALSIPKGGNRRQSGGEWQLMATALRM